MICLIKQTTFCFHLFEYLSFDSPIIPNPHNAWIKVPYVYKSIVHPWLGISLNIRRAQTHCPTILTKGFSQGICSILASQKAKAIYCVSKFCTKNNKKKPQYWLCTKTEKIKNHYNKSGLWWRNLVRINNFVIKW